MIGCWEAFQPRDTTDRMAGLSYGCESSLRLDGWSGCRDYRAGATIDFEMDSADKDRKIGMPLLLIWATRGAPASPENRGRNPNEIHVDEEQD